MAPDLPLSAQLSRVLVQFTRDFEREGEGMQPAPSLVLWSNLLWPIGEDEVRVVDLPKRARLSRRAIATCLKSRWVEPVPGPGGRGEKRVRLSDGRKVLRDAYPRIVGEVEGMWRDRYGAELMERARSALAPIVEKLDDGLPHCPKVRFAPASGSPRSPTERRSASADQTNLKTWSVAAESVGVGV